METGCLAAGSTGAACPSLVLAAIALLSTVQGQPYMGGGGGGMMMPMRPFMFRPIVLPPVFYQSMWDGQALGGRMLRQNWFRQQPTFRPAARYIRQWNAPRMVPQRQVRRPTFVTPMMTYTVPPPKPPAIPRFTKAPAVQRIQKKPRISVLSGPLIDVKPFPMQNRGTPMKKQLSFKSVARAKPFHEALSGTSLGINKSPG